MRIDKKFSAAVRAAALLGGVGVSAVAHETRTDERTRGVADVRTAKPKPSTGLPSSRPSITPMPSSTPSTWSGSASR